MTMTQAKWDSLSPAERDRIRSTDNLTPQLVGLEGWRVEVIDCYRETRRFIVGRSAGWKPCHIELAKRNSHGGPAVHGTPFFKVRKLYKVR